MEGIQRIEALIGQIEASADPDTRSTVRELVSAILEYHGEGLDADPGDRPGSGLRSTRWRAMK